MCFSVVSIWVSTLSYKPFLHFIFDFVFNLNLHNSTSIPSYNPSFHFMSQVLFPFVPPYWSEPAVGLLAQCLSLGAAKVLAKSQAGSLEKQAEWRFGNHVSAGVRLATGFRACHSF